MAIRKLLVRVTNVATYGSSECALTINTDKGTIEVQTPRGTTLIEDPAKIDSYKLLRGEPVQNGPLLLERLCDLAAGTGSAVVGGSVRAFAAGELSVSSRLAVLDDAIERATTKGFKP